MEEQKQCQAITASGEQCSRPAKDGEDYCGIHLGKVEMQFDPNLPAIKIVQRYIATGVPKEGSVSVDDLQSYLTAYINLGYKLFNTHYIGQNPEGLGVIFILTL